MESTILLVAQVSATLTTLMGIVTLVLISIATSKLAKDRFRDMLRNTFWFVLIGVIGVTSMTVYHFAETMATPEIAELTDNIWYVFMIMALIVSCYVSLNIASFGKQFK